jgi:uncharacterized protein (TIGR02246 family)
MPREDSQSADEAAIRSVINGITKAVRAKDVEAFLSHCAPDIVAFDMLPPLEQEGAETIRRNWDTALSSFEGTVEYEVRKLAITAGGDAAFSRCLAFFGGTTKDGKRIVNWLRLTLGFRRIDGQWKVIHQHVSVPFDMENGKAILDLKP